jgi:predicted metal-binding membrane protein
MGGIARRLDAWLVVLVATSLVAWSVVAFAGSDLTLPALCSAGTLGGVPLSASFALALVVNAPAKLACDWALMVAAMMSPLVITPLQHLRDRSFAKRRARAALLFVGGYALVWMAAGAALVAVALATRLAAPAPLVGLGAAAALALAWQVSPAKQWCLNRCHRRPPLAAFGVAADRDAFVFGLTNGAACVGTCWALMLLPLLAGPGHLWAMIAVSLFVFAERLESPAPLGWRWRGPGKALRLIAAQARMHLNLRSRIREASQ